MKVNYVTGDRVRLVSGGPDMTIRGVHFDVLANQYNESMFDCIWFEKTADGKREVHYCPFNNDELIKVEEVTNGAIS